MLDGIDYCLDWKPDDEAWSAREIVFHIVDTPSEGVHTAVQRVLRGNIAELPITASLTNLTPERWDSDLSGVRDELEAVLTGLELALSCATDADLTERTVALRSITRSTVQDRSAKELIEGIFLRHWREHLDQLGTLRELLGLD